jgi:hypothetical protein
MFRFALLALLVTLTGCTVALEESRGQISIPKAPRDRCTSLSNWMKWEGATAKGGAVLTGATGISTWPVGDKYRPAMAITTGVLGAGTAFVMFLEESDANSWARECAK